MVRVKYLIFGVMYILSEINVLMLEQLMPIQEVCLSRRMANACGFEEVCKKIFVRVFFVLTLLIVFFLISLSICIYLLIFTIYNIIIYIFLLLHYGSTHIYAFLAVPIYRSLIIVN